MFQWYKNAAVCFAYLEDLSPDTSPEVGLERCRWFTRGWTLQELIAPKEVRFLDQNWNDKGTKDSLQDAVSWITGIRKDILLGTATLGNISAAQKMSWAAYRKTTRQEDIAYSLLGIFEVNMALIYGEGSKAFTRLQEEIIKHTNDLSIFAWDPSVNGDTGPYCGVLAESPAVFRNQGHLQELSTTSRPFVPEFSITNRGLRITTELRVSTNVNVGPQGYFLCLSNFHIPPGIGIYLKKVGQSYFIRLSHMPLLGHLDNNNIHWEDSVRLQTIYIATHTSAADTTSLDGAVAGYPPLHFPIHRYLRIEDAYPRTSWDDFNRLFHTGVSGVSGFVGVICCHIFGDSEWRGPHQRVGIVVRTIDMECRVFKWDSNPQEPSILFGKAQKAPNDMSQAELVRFYSDIPPAKSIYWETRSAGSMGRRCEYRVCVELRSEVDVAISTTPVYSVRIEVFSREYVTRSLWRRGGVEAASWVHLH